jgi:hypothetical protein
MFPNPLRAEAVESFFFILDRIFYAKISFVEDFLAAFGTGWKGLSLLSPYKSKDVLESLG